MTRSLPAALRGIGAELWALFVDDGVFAGAILLWLLIGGFGLSRLGLTRLDLPGWLAGPLLFLGLALILVAGALRACRKRGF